MNHLSTKPFRLQSATEEEQAEARRRQVRRRQQLGALGCLGMIAVNGLLWALAFGAGYQLFLWLRA